MLLTRRPPVTKAEVDPLDIYLFDCTGMAILRNVIPEAQIQRAKSAIEKTFPSTKPWKFSVLNLDEVFWDIMTNSKMLANVEQLCGDQFRLDHAFSVTSDGGIINLHGGPASSFGSCFTRVDNQLMVGQLSCGVALTKQSPKTGGMCFIPGSHHSSDVRTGSEIRKQLLKGSMQHESLIVPTLSPGDVVLFSESLVHGDTGWNNPDYARIITYYKFCPGHMTWRDPREQEKYIHLARTDLERRLVEAPWSGQFSDENHTMDNVNKRRGKTLQ